MKKVALILLAGGSGTRMQSSLPKQYHKLIEKPLALHSFELFEELPSVEEIVVVCEPEYRHLFKSDHVHVSFALPGKRRQDSMENGFNAITSQAEFVCIHDSARPLVKKEDVENVINEGFQHGAATLAVPLKFTIKQTDRDGFVEKTLDRSQIWEIQTPQVLRKNLLHKGLQKVKEENIEVTDDVAIAELLGAPVKLVKGCYTNLKVTTPDDLSFAKHIISSMSPCKIIS